MTKEKNPMIFCDIISLNSPFTSRYIHKKLWTSRKNICRKTEIKNKTREFGNVVQWKSECLSANARPWLRHQHDGEKKPKRWLHKLQIHQFLEHKGVGKANKRAGASSVQQWYLRTTEATQDNHHACRFMLCPRPARIYWIANHVCPFLV